MTSRQPPPKETRNISAIMRKVSSSNTTPELLLRQALRAQKIRYRLNNTELPGKPDLVFPKARVAVFVDGDFWHGGQWRKRKLAALEDQFAGNINKEYWLKKIRRNMDRDCIATAKLLAQGWTVMRFWERDIEKRLEECVGIIVDALTEGYPPARSECQALSVIPRRTVAEFLAGFGFMRMGLEKEGWSVAFATETDSEKRRMYEGHFGKNEPFFEGDVHQISGGAIPEVTLATAFFSENDLSWVEAGERLRGKKLSAFWEFIRMIGEMEERKPPFVLLEIGAKSLSSQSEMDLKEGLGAINILGYQVDAFIIDAARFVPQRGKRFFVLGILDGIVEGEDRDQERDWESEVRPKPLVEFILNHPEIRWRIRDLPACPKGENELESILEEVPENSELWWSAERAGYLLGQMSPRVQAVAVRMINQDSYRYGMILRRVRFGESRVELRTDGMMKQMRALACESSLGNGEQIVFKAGKGKYFVRPLTPREWGRIMGVDDYGMSVPENEAWFRLGNEVCVPVIQWIARYYLNPLVTELIRGKPIRPVALPPSKSR